MSFARSLRETCTKEWEDCYRHPFVQELGRGTLDREAFRFYLVQDYVYLFEYARVFAAGALKARDERNMANFTAMQHAILHTEMDLHRAYMKEFGIDAAEAARAKPSLFSRAYTSNMLAVAQAGDAAEILAVVLPCAWSYYDYATRLQRDFADRLAENFYRSWIESYASQEYADGIAWLFGDLDRLCEGKSQEGLATVADLFRASAAFEYLFWDMAYKRQMSY